MLNKEYILNTFHKIPGSLAMESGLFFNKKPYRGFGLSRIKNGKVLPQWIEAARLGEVKTENPKKILIFATLSYWISYSTALALAYQSMGHDVEFVYFPVNRKYDPVAKFEYNRYAFYAKRALNPLEEILNLTCLTDLPNKDDVPEEIITAVKNISIWDVQYKTQLEQVDQNGEIFKIRFTANLDAAKRFYAYLKVNRPDVVIVPNGLILEYGVLQAVCKFLSIPTTSYEFGEQKQRIWISREKPIMLMDTSALWEKAKKESFTEAQKEKIQAMYIARRGADVYEQFSRRWQSSPLADENDLRAKLRLDERPIALLATNVIGDSLTLGRDIFSDGIQGWIKGTLDYFSEHHDVQLVIRVHPGELYLPDGPSVADLVRGYFDKLPEHIHLIEADDSTNTYSLINIAAFGLTYTTTVGMELAMSGVPVVVVGQTHYRDKGFTLDPESWEDFHGILDNLRKKGKKAKMKQDDIDDAWHYAYAFFYEYPHIFPWHMVHFNEDVLQNPIADVLTKEGMDSYFDTFEYMVFNR